MLGEGAKESERGILTGIERLRKTHIETVMDDIHALLKVTFSAMPLSLPLSLPCVCVCVL